MHGGHNWIVLNHTCKVFSKLHNLSLLFLWNKILFYLVLTLQHEREAFPPWYLPWSPPSSGTLPCPHCRSPSWRWQCSWCCRRNHEHWLVSSDHSSSETPGLVPVLTLITHTQQTQGMTFLSTPYTDLLPPCQDSLETEQIGKYFVWHLLCMIL